MEKSKIIVLVLVAVVAIGTIIYFLSDEEPEEINGEPHPDTGFLETEIDISGEHIYGVGEEIAYISGEGGYNVVHGERELSYFDEVFPPIVDVNGEPAYNALDGEEQVFMVGEDKKTSYDPYTHIRNVKEIGNEVVYTKLTISDDIVQDMGNVQDQGDLIDYYGEKVVETLMVGDEVVTDDYFQIENIVEVDGEIAFRALNENGNMVVVHGEEEIGEHSFVTDGPFEIGGNLVYLASDSTSAYLVIDGEKQEAYRSVDMLTDIGGEPAYAARESRYDFVVVGGEEKEKYGIPYEGINHLRDINGDAFYIVENRHEEEFVVFDGEEGSRYDAIEYVEEINGEPVYRVLNDDVWHIMRGLDEEIDSIDESNGKIGRPVDIGGDISYKVREDDVEYIIKGDEETDAYDWISDPMNFGDEIGYVAQEDGDRFFVYDGHYTSDFDSFSSVINLNELPKLLGVRGGQKYLIELVGDER